VGRACDFQGAISDDVPHAESGTSEKPSSASRGAWANQGGPPEDVPTSVSCDQRVLPIGDNSQSLLIISEPTAAAAMDQLQSRDEHTEHAARVTDKKQSTRSHDATPSALEPDQDQPTITSTAPAESNSSDEDEDLPQGPLRDLTRAAMLRMPHGQRKKFLAAEDKELKAIEDLEVIEGMVPTPRGVKPIETRFVYSIKDPVTQEGPQMQQIAKARLTMKDTKRGGDNLRATFAPTGQAATFRWLMIIAMLLNLLCDHIDVNTAFLYAKLTAPMVIKGAPGRMCPPGFFLKFPGLSTIQMIYIYVDDILVSCADRLRLNAIKAKIKERVVIKDLGLIKSRQQAACRGVAHLLMYLSGKVGMGPTPFFMDATAALYALKNPALCTRSKHIDVEIKWLMMNYLQHFIYIHVRTEDMTADLLTKPSALKVWVKLIRHLMGIDMRSSVQLQLAQERAKGLPYPKRPRIHE
jgi:hypothetical protein